MSPGDSQTRYWVIWRQWQKSFLSPLLGWMAEAESPSSSSKPSEASSDSSETFCASVETIWGSFSDGIPSSVVLAFFCGLDIVTSGSGFRVLRSVSVTSILLLFASWSGSVCLLAGVWPTSNRSGQVGDGGRITNSSAVGKSATFGSGLTIRQRESLSSLFRELGSIHFLFTVFSALI